MKTVVLLMILFTNVVTSEYTSLEMENCNTNINSPASISSMSVTPMPVTIPGDIYFSADMTLTRPVGESSLTLSIKRKTYWFDIPIPCILNVGSCTYDNICTMVKDMRTENWAGIMGNIGTQIKSMMNAYGIDEKKCPQPPRSVSIRNYRMRIPTMPAVLSWFAAGDYSAKIVVTEKSTRNQLLCLKLNLSLKKACVGFRCLFGK